MELNQDQFYIVRAKNAGVFFGKIKNRNGVESVTMTDVRKLWYWEGAAPATATTPATATATAFLP